MSGFIEILTYSKFTVIKEEYTVFMAFIHLGMHFWLKPSMKSIVRLLKNTLSTQRKGSEKEFFFQNLSICTYVIFGFK